MVSGEPKQQSQESLYCIRILDVPEDLRTQAGIMIREVRKVC